MTVRNSWRGPGGLGVALGCASVLLLTSVELRATTYYVRTCSPDHAAECSDENDGLAPPRAWATIDNAAEQLRDRGNPGDVVIVGPGTYQEGDIDLMRSGIEHFPITFRGDSSGQMTGDPPGPVLVDVGRQYDTAFLVFGASDVAILGFHVTNARIAGIQVRPDKNDVRPSRVVVANNIIFSNGAAGVGRGVQVINADDVLVFNNLIYANASTGIAVGGFNPGARNAHLVNNTLYGNGYAGIVAGERIHSQPTGTWAINNIIAANGSFAIDITNESTCDYVAAFNLVTNGYGPETPRDPSDIRREPLFVDPAGPDGQLGGAGFADDNFALSAVAAGQAQDSPAIDAGSEEATVFGVQTATTQTDGAADGGIVDLGYHAGNLDYPVLETLPIPVHTLYVRATGSDASDGLELDRALASVSRALELARAQTRIIVGAGTYREGNLGAKLLKLAGPIEFFGDEMGEWTGDPPGRVMIDARGWLNGFNIIGHCSTIVSGFNVKNAGDIGIFVKRSRGSIVQNNVVFSNKRVGINVIDSSDVLVRNNLVYANGSIGQRTGGGIQVGGTDGSHRVVIESNTVYGNGVNGILIGTGGVPSTQARVRYNIMSGNGENGIQLDNNVNGGLSAIGYCAAYNINPDGYGRVAVPNCRACMAAANVNGPCALPACLPDRFRSCTIRPPSDLTVAPAFVNPSGTDACLGRTRFADDDFHLRQVAAGHPVDSPGVDYSDQTAEMVGLSDRSTRTDGVPDSGSADLGFHYPPLAMEGEVPMAGDCDGDGRTTVSELVRGVNIALGNATLELCPPFDLDDDGWVSVNELVRSVAEILCF